MNIHEQIKQFNIALSGTLDLYRVWAKNYNISYNTLVILYTLDNYKICTQKQICEWWALPKQTVHGILMDFEKKEYLTLKENEANKRERLITFTESGSVYAASILKELYKMEENTMLKLGEVQRKQLIDSTTKYFELFKEEIEHGEFTS